MDDKAHPCPFCGSGKLYIQFSAAEVFQQCCHECRARGPEAASREEALQQWQKRAPAPAAATPVARRPSAR